MGEGFFLGMEEMEIAGLVLDLDLDLVLDLDFIQDEEMIYKVRSSCPSSAGSPPSEGLLPPSRCRVLCWDASRTSHEKDLGSALAYNCAC